MGRAAERQDGPMREVIILHIGEMEEETSSPQLQIVIILNLASKFGLNPSKKM